MHEALLLSLRGLGWTSPNPPVGCVLARDGVVIGRGWHTAPGELHAETAALRDAGDARGATCYVTLEPCSHTGRQPPCVSALAEAGVARVVYACADTDPRTAGRARTALEGAAIAVENGPLEESCRRVLEPYLRSHERDRAYCHLKLALSLDAKLACAGGDSQWLSGPESLGLAHFLRQQHDAILVGRGTVEADDPQLTVRDAQLRPFADPDGIRLRDPIRVVIDPGLRVLEKLDRLRLSRRGTQRCDRPGLILIAEENPGAGTPAAELSEAAVQEALSVLPVKAEVVRCTVLGATTPSCSAELDLQALLKALRGLGIQSVLAEGGARTAQALLAQHAVDRLTAVYTPRLIGSDGQDFAPALGLRRLSEAPRLARPEVLRLGDDTVLTLPLDSSSVLLSAD